MKKLLLYVGGAVAGVLLLVGVVVSIFSSPAPEPAPTETTGDSNQIFALRFYSGSLSTNARRFIYDWFQRRSISTAANNFSVHEGSYTERLYAQGDKTYRDITFIVDLKTPLVSYEIYSQIDANEPLDALTYITCPEPNNQHGEAGNCEGISQL